MNAPFSVQSSIFGVPTRKPAAGSLARALTAPAGAGARFGTACPGPALYAAVSYAIPTRRCSIHPGCVGQIVSVPRDTFALATNARALAGTHRALR